jgi:hypothetical protein
MNDLTLIKRDDAALDVTFTPEAEAMKADALAVLAIVHLVRDESTHDAAVEAQKTARKFLDAVEKPRSELSGGLSKQQRALNKKCREFVGEVEKGEMRVAALIGDFQQAEIAKVKAAEAKNNAALTVLEKERETLLAAAPTLEARNEIQEDFNHRAAAVVEPLPTIIRAAGQVVKEDWEIVVVDIHALYRAHPVAVKLTAVLTEIRNLLDMGVTVKGVSAKKIVKASTRSTKESAIEVGS